MRICVNEITHEGLDLRQKISPKELGLETEQVHYTSAVNVKAHAEKEKNILTVFCDIEVQEKRICSRCLEEFTFSFKKREDFIYTLQGEHTIEINDNIKDTIMLDYPIKQLCKEDCKGLCGCCGKNLNYGECSCKKGKDMICQE